MRIALTFRYACKHHRPALLLAVLLFLPGSPLLATNLYKWVDEDGSVHYSSQLPPDQSRKSHQELNSRGMVLTTKEAAKSEEELAGELEKQRLLEEQRAEEARLKKIQDAKDRVLLLTFASEDELVQARDNRIEVIDSVIRLINSSIETTQEKLEDLQTTANDSYISNGKEVPGGLAQKIEFFERKLESRNVQLASKEAEKEKIRQKYEADLERYRLLKTGGEAAPAASAATD